MAAEPLQFNRDIRPILSDHCFACHGPDRNQRAADLRLDVREEAVEKGAIRPERPAESLLVSRMESEDPELQMPPVDSPKQLTAAQKAILRRWIAEGAAYQPHWAFVPPVLPPIPQVDQPSSRLRNPIDAFIFKPLVEKGGQPSPEASKETLIRRVTLDLTGLPPTIAEVDAFLGDDSESAYEKLVDRLLRSPHYGERMAIDWLDAARYADSNGYQVDRDRELWPWRDWVIRAFNENKPFDQFTIEQLAGDLLPEASLEQRIATGLHRNHMLNEEGGIIAEEFLAEYTADRVETTTAIWLGQTFNCARCHDHKFDPFTQRDFYSLKAFFHNVPEQGVGIYAKDIRINAPPFVRLPVPSLESKIAKLKTDIDELEGQYERLSAEAEADIEAWAEQLDSLRVTWQTVDLLHPPAPDSRAEFDLVNDTVDLLPGDSKPKSWKVRFQLPPGRFTALRLESRAIAAEASWRWVKVQLRRDRQLLRLRAASSEQALAVSEVAKLLDENAETLLLVSLNGEQRRQAVFEFDKALENTAAVELELELVCENLRHGMQWQLSVADIDSAGLVPDDIRSIAARPPATRRAADTKKLKEYFRSQQPELRRLTDRRTALQKQLTLAESQIPTSLVMAEMEQPRETFVLMRGAYDKPGEAVTAATPAVLPPMDPSLPRNRLGLAQWLVSPDHPLTARVTVNRFWQQLFGVGLVRTSEDFGSQGEQPSHPELLDWLAVTFRESGWDIKHLIRLMVTSATYRQQSRWESSIAEMDPENRWLARGPRYRWIAEVVRDQALAASGLLVSTVGGPSVRPYHPPGIYEQLTSGRGYNVYVPGTGSELYRRSLYTYWKRSVPHPAMLLFDAPFRESCVLRRSRSNTPLQALNLMNDPTYVEAARFLAQRMLLEAGPSLEDRLVFGFRALLSRRPTSPELGLLKRAYDRCHRDFTGDVAAAEALLAVGNSRTEASLDPVELAAMTTVASTLLNLDETITKP
jgi:hypothetical protein